MQEKFMNTVFYILWYIWERIPIHNTCYAQGVLVDSHGKEILCLIKQSSQTKLGSFYA